MRKLIFLLTFSPSVIFCQNLPLETISSGGSHHNSNNVVLDWTLGELASESISSVDIKLTQGFNQGSLIISTNSLDLNSTPGVYVYPNPTQRMVFIEVENINDKELILYDLFGVQLINLKISEQKTSIDLSPYSSGLYILSIFSGMDFIQSVSIEKIH